MRPICDATLSDDTSRCTADHLGQPPCLHSPTDPVMVALRPPSLVSLPFCGRCHHGSLIVGKAFRENRTRPS